MHANGSRCTNGGKMLKKTSSTPWASIEACRIKLGSVHNSLGSLPCRSSLVVEAYMTSFQTHAARAPSAHVGSHAPQTTVLSIKTDADKMLNPLRPLKFQAQRGRCTKRARLSGTRNRKMGCVAWKSESKNRSAKPVRVLPASRTQGTKRFHIFAQPWVGPGFPMGARWGNSRNRQSWSVRPGAEVKVSWWWKPPHKVPCNIAPGKLQYHTDE